MLKTSRTMIAVAALSATLVGGGAAWASTTHASGRASVASLQQSIVTIQIPAKRGTWTDTGVALQAHHTLAITAKGMVDYNGPKLVSPSGYAVPSYTCTDYQWPGGTAPFIAPQDRCLSLIGKIANGNPFQVGRFLYVSDSAAGELFLMMNDSYFGDNSGSWTVTIITALKR